MIQTGLGAVIKLNMIESAEVRTFGHINSTELWPRVGMLGTIPALMETNSV